MKKNELVIGIAGRSVQAEAMAVQRPSGEKEQKGGLWLDWGGELWEMSLEKWAETRSYKAL